MNPEHKQDAAVSVSTDGRIEDSVGASVGHRPALVQDATAGGSHEDAVGDEIEAGTETTPDAAVVDNPDDLAVGSDDLTVGEVVAEELAWPDVPLTAEQTRGMESLLFLADEPLDVLTIAHVLEANPQRVEEALEALATRYLDEQRGMEIRAFAGGWRMYTSAATRPFIERWALAGRTGRLTPAALETLAVITYKQPVGRQEISDIRGVNADGAVRSLIARGLVTEVGRDVGPGQAALFGTTPTLLERLGLRALDQLPELTDFLPGAPAPDEPDLTAFREIRRRLAAGGDLTTARHDTATGATGSQPRLTPSIADDEDDDALPSPTRKIGERHGDEAMDALTDRLEEVARNAVGRLRDVVAASAERDPERDPERDDVELNDTADPVHDHPSTEDTPSDSSPDVGADRG